MILRFAPQAEADLRTAVAYVRERNPQAAEKLATRILGVTEMLAAGEITGPEQRLTTGEIVNSWPVPPFRIYYRVRGEVLEILRVYHSARAPLTR